MKNCPFCDEEIRDNAIKCKHCGSMLAAPGGAAMPDGAMPPGAVPPGSGGPAKPTPFYESSGHPDGSDPLDRMGTIPSFNEGMVIDGRYEVLLKLGEGGMGKVYMTKDREMAEDFRAVKILPRQVGNDLKAIGRLKEEARIAMTLNHENIVRLYHYDHDGDVHYLVMEYINGIDLQTYLGVKGKLPEDEVRRVGLAIARGLKHAHARKVVHRDIKPSNILLESPSLDIEEIKGKYPDLTGADVPDLSGAKVRLTDFGIARQVRESMSRYSRGDTSGTLMYMSPEQIRGKGVDQRSDLYSLGVTLYELLTGDPPFTGESLTHQILSEDPMSIEGIDPVFNAILMRLLAKDKEKRFRDADELIAALEGKESREAERRRTEEEQRKEEEAKNAAVESVRLRREEAERRRIAVAEKARQEAEAKAKQEAEAKAQAEAELVEKGKREAERIAEEERKRKEEEAQGQRRWEAKAEEKRPEAGSQGRATQEKKLPKWAFVLGVLVLASVVAFGVIRMRNVMPEPPDGKVETTAPAPAPAPAPAVQTAPAVSVQEQKRAEGIQYLDRAKAALDKGRLIEAREYYEDAQKRIADDKVLREFGKKLLQAESKLKDVEEKTKKEEEARIQRTAEERAKQIAAETQAKREAEEKARQEEDARIRQAAAAEKGRQEAEAKARQAAEEKVRQDAAARAKQEAEKRITAGAGNAFSASKYPERPITIIVHAGPGGGSDIFARNLASGMERNRILPQPLVVENKPGGGGAIAFTYVAGKKRDPYYLVTAVTSFLTTPLMGLTPVGLKDFTPVANFAFDEYMLMVGANSRFKSVREVIDFARANPRKITVGGTQLGSSDSICTYMIEKATGVQFNYVVFNGGGEVNAALLGGHIDMAITNPGEALLLYKAGKIKLLGVFSEKRLAIALDVPTLKEQGINAVYLQNRGICAPAGIPSDALMVLEEAFRKYTKTETFKQYSKENMLTEAYMDGAAFGRFLDEWNGKYYAILKDMNLIRKK